MLCFLVATLLFTGAGKPPSLQTKHSFTVKVTGEGPAVILIPGLMCGGGVWDSTVEHLKSHYTCYVLTLPGFAGVAPIKPPMLSTVRDEIEAFVAENKLERPMLVGHSLGGTLALWLAADKPSMFGGVVSVDGVPYLGALADRKQSPATLQATISTLKTYFSGMDAKRLAAANAISLPHLITEPANVAKVAAEANKSDPPSIGEAIGEMYQNDLRPLMTQVSAPVLLIVPDGNGGGLSVDVLKARYEAEVTGILQHQVVITPKSRHFIMFDNPGFFFDRLDDFLIRSVHRG